MNGDQDGTVTGGLGELDRPGRPGGADAWDGRSEEWLPGAEEGGSQDALSGSGSPGPVPVSGAGFRGGRTGAKDTAGSRRSSPRRGAADPVKALMHRHRTLCERAVDPLEIAAGLEAHGVTDRTAARFRHRDVFSLAEELYARVPRDGDRRPRPEPAPATRVRADWALLTLLPGAVGAAVVTGVRIAEGR
ncbi:hypothetical protein ABZ357_36620, partial [Streptomyces sp. NPDC005917]